MPLARTRSITLLGVTGVPVEVEADLGNGLPGITIVGLPDASLNESRDRVRAAVVNSGEQWPQRRITVGLSPAPVHKRGSGFDLAVAVAVLAAAGSVPPEQIAGVVLLGELGLDGRVRAVRGVLPSVIAAAAHDLRQVVVPDSNLAEACLVPDVDVLGVRSLSQLVALLRGDADPSTEAEADPSTEAEADPSTKAEADPSTEAEADPAAERGRHLIVVRDPRPTERHADPGATPGSDPETAVPAAAAQGRHLVVAPDPDRSGPRQADHRAAREPASGASPKPDRGAAREPDPATAQGRHLVAARDPDGAAGSGADRGAVPESGPATAQDPHLVAARDPDGGSVSQADPRAADDADAAPDRAGPAPTADPSPTRSAGRPAVSVVFPVSRTIPAGPISPAPDASTAGSGIPAQPDLADVRGQLAARRALEICAAGGHHLFLYGSPGAGKTMLAERLPGLLPPLDRETALEVTAIHSVAGLLPADRPLISTAPFCAPHHTASLASLVGGGSHQLRPGAVSISHRGVLFLDEAVKSPPTPDRRDPRLPDRHEPSCLHGRHPLASPKAVQFGCGWRCQGLAAVWMSMLMVAW